MSSSPSRIVRVKVSLLYMDSPIWRIIEVPETYTFWDLHVAIQDAMGWLDYHLHAFMSRASRGSEAVHIGIPSGPLDDEVLAGWEVPITRHLANPGDAIRYTYDFGDDWAHRVELLAIEPAERGATYPRCIDGERACPPEDCGGIPGYYELLEILADPSDDEHEEMVAWLKGHAKNYWPYKADEFDPASVTFQDPTERLEMMMDRRG